mgnify:CR=1 FL=1
MHRFTDMASTKRRPKGVKGGPKASQRTRLEDLMTVLNDLELKGHMRELLGATSSWNTSDVHDYSDVQGMPPPRLPSHQGKARQNNALSMHQARTRTLSFVDALQILGPHS